MELFKERLIDSDLRLESFSSQKPVLANIVNKYLAGKKIILRLY